MNNKSHRFTFHRNIIKGKLAETIAKQDYKEHGFEIKETGIGSDFIVRKKRNGTTYEEYVDVKSGNAKLTKKQKITRGLLKKNNISYSIYRVTDEHLKFQICNNPELQQLCFQMGFDISQFAGIFLIEDPTNCPNCKLGATGMQNILTRFGLRNMGDGTVRVQSWCRNCRDFSRRGIK
ncbi:hypothetical protein [Candidatus Nitrosopumilus sediminis]|uniref:Uncharacterized protein n=1 Tax=Candidatus Nitrosopumilus sediminis TaxID=1229909 RepID=K0BEC2_9ARCH|nr:hypothetical protein [Candidatus Nitrosopumilus sediminis]AFS83375.1 hypothetical protein NSED_07915 [Candidatus Nitrosopumilus sediminis]